MPIGLGIGLGFGGARAWTPVRLGSALGLWAKLYTDATGVTLNGSKVSAWSDRSGTGRTITQGTAGNQPSWVADDGDGRPAIDFGNAGTYKALAITTDLLRNRSGAAVFMVNKPTSASVANVMFKASINGGVFARAALATSAVTVGKYLEATCTDDTGAGYAAQEGGTVTAAWQVWGANWNFAGNTVDLRKNGLSIYSGVHGSGANATPDTASDTLIIGSNASDDTGGGKFREIVVATRLLTAAEVSALERYLAAGWGL